jgi:hypothetical protein
MNKMLLFLVVVLASCQAGPEQVTVVVEQAPMVEIVQLSWRSGELPVGHPVAAAWKAGNTVIMRAVIRTDFAGIFEWWGDDRPAWPVEREPDWWAPLPKGMNP